MAQPGHISGPGTSRQRGCPTFTHIHQSEAQGKDKKAAGSRCCVAEDRALLRCTHEHPPHRAAVLLSILVLRELGPVVVVHRAWVPDQPVQPCLLPTRYQGLY